MHYDNPTPTAARSRTAWRHVRPLTVGFAVVLLVAALLWFVFLDDSSVRLRDQWSRMHDIDELAQSIRSYGNWGVAASIGLMVVHSFLPFPAEAVALANGPIYGTLFGTLVTWIGAMLGAQAAFWAARTFGTSFVERHVPAARRARFDRWTARNGAAALVTMRLIPIIAFNLVNYAAGLARVPWWTFTWTTAVGILPLTFLMVAAGDQMKNVPLRLVGALLLGGLLLWTLYSWLRKRLARSN